MSKRLTVLVPLVFFCLFSGNSISAESPTWVVHASDPGADVPAVGNSLFDKLFLQQQDGKTGYQIPYPFDALIQYLQSRVENGSKPSVPRVLIPIGRSLQRNTAAPDFFEFPRSVITLEGEPVTGTNQAGNVMNYRFFIGYQEKAEALEVISFNEEAGRFEFQLVENYRSGDTPRVRAANRALCMSCHQNGAAIFASLPWSETNFNPAVGLELIRVNPRKYSSLVSVLTVDAQAIDLASKRANYLAPSQLIWQLACESESAASLTSYQCRAGILEAVLQYRLSGELGFNSESSTYRFDFFRQLANNWQFHWPHGLSLQSAEIPDLDPFKPAQPNPALDPLSPRPIQAFWKEATDVLAKGLVYRLAGFFTEADIARLDRRLIELGSNETMTYRSKCRVTTDLDSGYFASYRLDCGDSSLAESINATIEMVIRDDDVPVLRITHLRLPNEPFILQPGVLSSRLEHDAETTGIDSQLVNASGKLSARLANGNRIAGMTLNWPRKSESSSYLPNILDFELSVIKDFTAISKALANMVTEARDGHSSALSSAAFNRRIIVTDLEKELGMNPLDWCCEYPQSDPKPGQDSPVVVVRGSAETAIYFEQCSRCHSGDTLRPPGFLRGDDRQVKQQLQQCTPRIFRRLSQWQADSKTGLFSPMPPVASLGIDNLVGTEWTASEVYRSLIERSRSLLIDEAGEAGLVQVLNADYEDLRPCLASE